MEEERFALSDMSSNLMRDMNEANSELVRTTGAIIGRRWGEDTTVDPRHVWA